MIFNAGGLAAKVKTGWSLDSKGSPPGLSKSAFLTSTLPNDHKIIDCACVCIYVFYVCRVAQSWALPLVLLLPYRDQFNSIQFSFEAEWFNSAGQYRLVSWAELEIRMPSCAHPGVTGHRAKLGFPMFLKQ